MWVVAPNDRVGICFKLLFPHQGKYLEVRGEQVATHAEFHRVLPDGTTSLISVLPIAELEQAKYEDIPESRRPAESTAAALGYL